ALALVSPPGVRPQILAHVDVGRREALAVEARLPRAREPREDHQLEAHVRGTGSARSNSTAVALASLRSGGRSSSTTALRVNVAPTGGRCGSGIRARSSSVSVRSNARRWR